MIDNWWSEINKVGQQQKKAHLRITVVEPGHNAVDEEANVLALDALAWVCQKVEQLHTQLEFLLDVGGREERHKAVHVSRIHCHLLDSRLEGHA